MAIPKEKDEGEVKSVGDLEEIGTSIRQEDLPFAYDAFLQYSDPIGSTVREITSNAIDAHKRKGTDKSVIVRITEEGVFNDTWKTFEVEDFGTGMSKEKVIEVYRYLFASDKRETNNEMGMFGLGSKSPLGYRQSFVVKTFKNKISLPEKDNFEVPFKGPNQDLRFLHYSLNKKAIYVAKKEAEELIEASSYYWTYTVYRRQGDSPGITKIDEGVSERESGTIVSVGIETGDKYKFEDAIAKQLAYFDGVKFVNCGIEESTIYEGDNFVYRDDNKFSEMHICYGNVYYPIDFDQLDLETEYSSYNRYKEYKEVTFGLKFDIGELEVVWNRESLEYTDKTIEAIEERVQDVIEEFVSLKEENTEEINSFGEWYKRQYSADNTLLSLESGSETQVDIDLNDRFLPGTFITYEPYTQLPKLPNNPFSYLFKTHRKVVEGYIDKRSGPAPTKLLRREVSGPWDKNNSYRYRNSDILIADESYRTKKNKYIYEELGKKEFYIVRPETKAYIERRASKFKENADDELDVKDYRLIQQFEKEAEEYFREQFESYDSISVPDDFTPSTKKTTTKKETSPDDEIPYKWLGNGKNYNRHKWNKDRMKIKDISESTTYIYGFRKDADNLENLFYLLDDNRRFSATRRGRRRDPIKLDIIKIAIKREKYFKDLPNAYHVDEWYDFNHRLYQRYITAKAIGKVLTAESQKLKRDEIPKTDEFVKAEAFITVLSDFVSRYNLSTIPEGHKEQAEENFSADPDMIRWAKYVTGFIGKYPMLKYVKSPGYSTNEGLREELKFYFKSKGEINPLLHYRYNMKKED